MGATSKISPIFSSIGPAQFETLFELSSDATWIISSQGVEAVNTAAEQMTGYSRKEFLGYTLDALYPRTSDPLPKRTRAISGERLTSSGTYEDLAIRHKDGSILVVELRVKITPSTGTIVTLRDVGERRRMESELISKHGELRAANQQLELKNTELEVMQKTLVQAGKMAALGELSAGIAHELNQPLQAIRGYAQEMDAQAAHPFLKEVIKASDKMAEIIGHLRNFTRQSTEDHKMIDPKIPIQDALKMVSRQLEARGIGVQSEFAPDLSKVYANPLQLEQVFINLTTNARDAITATGRGRGQIRINARNDGDFVAIDFYDDGVGMDEETRRKIFNPFFTTKEVGQGMGLGLSLSYGMLEKIHGSILVESNLGKGTTFKVRLPLDFRKMG